MCLSANMKQIANLIHDLARLSELDSSKHRLRPKSSQFNASALEIEGIRQRLPTAILKHYDHRISKGKRGAAKIRNGTCGGCHLTLPSGQLADMRREGVALQVCGHCSVFILPEDPAPQEEPAAVVPGPRTKAQSQSRKAGV